MNIGGATLSIQEYWQRVRALQADLVASLPQGAEQLFWIITEADQRSGLTGGTVCQCDAEMTAKMLFARTHRLATEAEVAAHNKAESDTRAVNAETEYKRKQNFALPKELTDLMTVAAQAAVNQKPENKGAKEAR